MLLFGLIFELPMLCYFLAKIGILTSEWMKKYRRHAVVVIFIVAGVLTPPDPITQIVLGIPLVLLYEASVYIVRAVEKAAERREKIEEEKFQQALKKDSAGEKTVAGEG
jgi:sec-independent protein translocase protein TatC